MKRLTRLFYAIFPHYKVLETRCVSWGDAELLLRGSEGKPEAERWVLAKEEDYNTVIGTVWLCRKIRITE